MSEAVQLWMAGFGLIAVVLALSPRPLARKWAPIVGLVSQPAWLIFGWQTNAWGLLTLSAAYTAVFAWGARVQWRAA